ncbi:MAG: cysteine desulfurase [Cyclobacteriaceae bacterium]|nr:cysteine desulfurase [Cyclobacteriaceae bacterium]
MDKGKRIYFDNAATTPVHPEVAEAMMPFLLNQFGNPSSIHGHGREVRSAIEKARRKVANRFNVSPSEVFFTSGATEADNTYLRGAVKFRAIRHVISSPIEHHAVIHTLEHMAAEGEIQLHLLHVDEFGNFDWDELESLLKTYPGALVSLMHGNNEIGNIADIERIGELCAGYDAVFHSDTVQTVPYLPLDLQKIKVHSIVGSAHKFHGPKGVGFLIVKSGFHVPPMMIGGGQERNMRGGTENVSGIIGMARALELAMENMDDHVAQISQLKKAMQEGLQRLMPDIKALGDPNHSLPGILNIAMPGIDDNDMLLFNLDINQISVSGGSACASGSSIGSHVLEAIKLPDEMGAIRFSFSAMNTIDEVNIAIQVIAALYQK